MTDQIQPPHSEHLEVDALETVTRQQNEIRGFVEARIGSEPLADARADTLASDFGLEEGKYDVYADTEAPFGGGFIKFAPKDNPSEALMGFTRPNIGGPTNNLNRSIDNRLIAPNGDIVGKISVENNEGIRYYDRYIPAGSQDPDAKAQYQRLVGIMHKQAQELMSPPPAENTWVAANPESGQQARGGRISRWLGRSSLR